MKKSKRLLITALLCLCLCLTLSAREGQRG